MRANIILNNKILFALTIIGFLSCESSKKKENDELEKTQELTAEQQQQLDDYKAEVEIGRNMAGRLIKFYGTYGNEELIQYLNLVGNYVASYGDAPERRYMFNILDTESVNVFACPGGYILVTLGTLRLAENEGEIAAILGHESAHVVKQHMYKSLKTMSKKELEDNVKNSEKKGLMPPAITVRKRPSTEGTKLGAVVAKYLSNTGTGLSVLSAASAGMSVIMEKGLDKKLEYEADQEGVKYSIRAGYYPEGLIAFLTRLESKTSKKEKKVISSTHPTIKNRKKRIEKLLASMDAQKIIRAKQEKRFGLYKEKLPTKEVVKSH